MDSTREVTRIHRGNTRYPKQHRIAAFTLVGVLLTTGCATQQEGGAAIGALAGAVVGAAVAGGSRDRRLIGALVGAAAGGFAG